MADPNANGVHAVLVAPIARSAASVQRDDLNLLYADGASPGDAEN